MSLVNETIFGFPTLEEYDDFIKLLIEIRTPKLSDGKNFKPSIITEIISNSLRPLSDEDLRPVAESIQNMNDTKEQLEQLKISYEAIEKLKNYYQTYNEAVLHQKAKNYNTTNTKWKKELGEEKVLRDKIENSKREIEENKKEKEKIEIEIESNEFTLEELRKDERFNLQKELEELKQNLQSQEKEITDQEKKVEDKKQEETKQGYKQKETLEQKEAMIDNFKKQEESASSKAKQIKYDEYFFRIDEVKENLEKEYQYESLNQDIKRYIHKIENGKKAMQEAKKAEIEYDGALQELDKKRKQESERAQEITKDRIALEEEKQNFIEELYNWEEKNELLKIQSEEKVKIAQSVQEYGEKGNFETILASSRIPYENVKGALITKQAGIRNKQEQIEQEKQEILKEIEEWKNQKEAEPVRSKAVIQNRERLKQNNIPFIPFYEVVEFKKDLLDEQKDILENALQEMGILDALIIENDNIQKQDKDFVDKYLLPQAPRFGHNALELFDIVMPENCQIKVNTISNILSNILLDDTTGGAYIDEQGNYRIGLLGGKASKQEPAKYIGKEAKRRYKERKIQELQELLSEKEKINEELQAKLDELKQKVEQLEQEWKNFPSNEKLEEKWSRIKIDTNILTSIKEEITIKEKQLQEKFDYLKQAKEKVEEETKGIYFIKTLEVFEENLELAIELKDELYEMQKTQNAICSLANTLQIIEEHLERTKRRLRRYAI